MVLRKYVYALAAVSALAGCDGIGQTLTPTGGALESVPLLGGAVTAAGPDGFCVSPDASRPRAGFAAITACNAITGEGALPFSMGLITVQAGEDGTASVAGPGTAFSDFLRSDAGAAVLSVSGNAADVTVDRVFSGDGAVTAVFTDKGDAPLPGTDPIQWRAFTDINGHLVTISLRSLTASPLAPAQGEALLRRAVRAILAANVRETVVNG